ncbi:DUF5712 family protein [Rapidithrix thailandica]|uniref:DUF5712 family protein n=1 Tax=Rapidithrix thailandica TaxID=413964 RepID=A0AAW9SEQ1_9BACT
MHSKIIDPARHGSKVYDNRSTAAFAVTYLGHEQGDKLRFFNQEREAVTAEEVIQALDHNIKGLRKEEEKFHCLVLSPSQEELRHIGNEEAKLKQFTQAVMENYARNFQRKKLTEKDLLWFACIHHERTYSHRELQQMQAEEKEGLQPGDKKPGLQTHIHVLVSRRDRSMRHTLNPRGQKKTFPIKTWQMANGKTFQQLFDYHREVTASRLKAGPSWTEPDRIRHDKRIGQKVDQLNNWLPLPLQLSQERIREIGRQTEYSKSFFLNLYRLEKGARQGKLPENPYCYLESSHKKEQSHSKARSLSLEMAGVLRKLSAAFQGKDGYTEDLTPRKKRNKEIDPSYEL